MIYLETKEKVRGYYWTPNRNLFFTQATKKCKNWQIRAVEIHNLLVDIKQSMATYTVGEYHLIMSKCLGFITKDE